MSPEHPSLALAFRKGSLYSMAGWDLREQKGDLMTQNYINQVFDRFSSELAASDTQAMTLSLRAHLLHEAKRLQDTLKALIVQSELSHPEIFLINTLEHFITCARLERAEVLKTSCQSLLAELRRVQSDRSGIAARSSWHRQKQELLQSIA